jgi:hypothetical protein
MGKAQRTPGTIKAVVFAGINLTPLADANLEFVIGKFKLESKATSGDPMVIFETIEQVLEAHDYGVSTSEVDELRAIANEGPIEHDASFTLRDGVVVSGTCYIELGKYETHPGQVKLAFHPTEQDAWTWS